MILCLETATPICSVALCDRNNIVALRESGEERSHASQLTVFIEDILKKTGVRAAELEAVAVSKGPGSYTGLRIGVSAGKGIAYAASVPLISIDTTFSMFLGFKEIAGDKYNILPDDRFCPALDARRMEIYYSVFDAGGKTVKEISAGIIDQNSFNDLPVNARLFIFGDGASKCREIISRDETVFVDTFKISASFMRKAAYDALDKKRFEDVAYFEPFYLKDFLATKPVKNILGK